MIGYDIRDRMNSVVIGYDVYYFLKNANNLILNLIKLLKVI
jgi:hypothetical protein